MPYFPGVGYGVAMLGSGVSTALLNKQKYEDEQDLKKRAQTTSEAAEARAKTYTEDLMKTSELARDEKVGTAYAKANAPTAASIGYPKTGVETPAPVDPSVAAEVAATPVAPVGPGAPTPSSSDAQGAADSVEQPETDVLGNPIVRDKDGNITTGNEDYVRRGPGVGDAVKAGDRVRVNTTPALRTDKTYGVTTNKDADAGLDKKSSNDVRAGKASTTPGEGDAMIESGTKMAAQAAEISKGLQDALKVVDMKFGKDSNLGMFMKANLRTQVEAEQSQLAANAAKLQRDGQLANFAQKGTQVASVIMAHLNKEGTINDAFIKQNEALFKETGMDASLLHGLHMSGPKTGDPRDTYGTIVNSRGLIIPHEAILRVGNPALPWTERVKGWHDITEMYKTQQELRIRWASMAQADPRLKNQWILDNTARVSQEYAERDRAYQSIMKTLGQSNTGNMRPIPIVVDGKNVNYTLPPQIMGKDETLAQRVNSWATSPDKNLRAIHSQIVYPLEQQRASLSTQINTLNAMAGVPAILSGQNEMVKGFNKAGGYGTAFGKTTGTIEGAGL